MKLLTVDTLNEAREKLLAAVSEKPMRTEQTNFFEGLGSVLAEDLKSAENIPDFRKSTVDGYAVRASDTQGVTESIPVFLDVIETVAMGTPPKQSVKPGQAVYVPTGGMVPDGADAMVMIEYCEKFDERSIAVYEPVSAGRNIIAIGEDVKKEQVVLEKGRKLSPREIGVLSSAGVHRPTVFKPWRVTVISTGDELIDAEQTPEKGQVRDINTYAVSAAAVRCGLEVIDTMVLKDDEALIESSIRKAMEQSDLVVVSGGSSQGEKDYTASVMDRLAEPGVFTHGIALKPGKPTILGYDANTETILVGLPGHPAAALMVFELIVGWLYRKLTEQASPVAVPAQITENVAAAGGKTTCLPVELADCDGSAGETTFQNGASCVYKATPIFGKSGLMTTLTKADGYVLIDTDDEGLTEGQQVLVTLF